MYTPEVAFIFWQASATQHVLAGSKMRSLHLYYMI